MRDLCARAVRLLLTALVLEGCAGTDTTDTDTDAPDTDTDTQVDTDTDQGTTLIETAWPPGDVGNLQIAHHVNTGVTNVFGVFAEAAPGFVNLAQCSISDAPCVGGFANDEDDFEDVDPDVEIDRETIRTRFLGFDIGFGPYTLPYYEDRETGFGFYAVDVSDQDLAEGWVGARWGGYWTDHDESHELFVSPPLELIAPRPNGHVFTTNGSYLPIEWVPTGRGTLTITVETRFSLFRMFRVEDDGYFELDLDALGLTSDTEELTLTLTRWDLADVVVEGNVVQMVATSDAWFTADYANIGSRQAIFVADTCDEAHGLQAVGTGGYWGRLDNKTDSISNANCLKDGSPTGDDEGKDAFVRVVVPPKSVLNVDYNTFTESASVYLLEECESGNSCVAGSDIDEGANIHEFTNYFNATEDSQELYVGLDTTGVINGQASTGDTVWTLDMTINTLIDPQMFDTCLETSGQPQTLTTAGYFEEFVAYTDDLNPGQGGCTNSSLSGADAIMPFELGPYQTFTVNVTMPGGDVGVYVLTNCNDVFSCVGGSDTSSAGTEQAVFTNTGGTAVQLFLVIDSKGAGMRPFVMGTSFQ